MCKFPDVGHQRGDVVRASVSGGASRCSLLAPPHLLTVTLKVIFVYVYVYVDIPARHIAQYSKNSCCCMQGPGSWRGKYYQYRLTVFCPDSQQVETLTTTDPYSLCLPADGTHTQVGSTTVHM